MKIKHSKGGTNVARVWLWGWREGIIQAERKTGSRTDEMALWTSSDLM